MHEVKYMHEYCIPRTAGSKQMTFTIKRINHAYGSTLQPWEPHIESSVQHVVIIVGYQICEATKMDLL
jgi:hypothetical protein